MPSAKWKSENKSNGCLEGPLGVPGVSRGSLGRSRGHFWSAGGGLENWGRHSGGSLGGARSVEKLPGSVFLRFLRAKYTYFQGFEHVNFVNLMWPLGAPGRSWEGSGRHRELQSTLWGAPGGSWKKGFGFRGAPGSLQWAKNAILDHLSFSLKRSRAYVYSGFSDFEKKHDFFSIWPCGISRGVQGGS